MKRSAPGIESHYVVIPLEKEQRTTFNDAVPQPNMTEANEDKKLYLDCLKYREVHKPYSDFIFYGDLMLIAHGNILSCYDVI